MDKELDVAETAQDAVKVEESAEIAPPKQMTMAEEFNYQRAKMKELYLQKEGELRRTHEEKVRLQSELAEARQQLSQLETIRQNQHGEIQSLSLLVQEAVDASSSESNEVRHLQARCAELEQHIAQLTKQQQQQEVSLAPSVLVQAMTKSIARKLGADQDRPDTLDESMKKAQEDTELLRSLVIPLEEEIKVLKDKLRDTDTQLQQALVARKNRHDGEPGCDMCANYEAQLVAEQSKSAEEAARARHAQLALKMATEELEKTTSIHSETLSAWKTEREGMEAELETLRLRLDEAERAVEHTRAEVAAADRRTLDRLTQLTVDRQTLQEHLNQLEAENARLNGRYLRKADEIRQEEISLPADRDELQLYALRAREDMLCACVGRETAEAAEEAIRGELLAQADAVRAQAERGRALARDNQRLQEQLQTAEAERAEAIALAERLKATETKLQDALADSSKLSQQAGELRVRVSSLQTELDNSEKVQQDFVRLSQSLQVQLERIREEGTEVRWQHDEDVSECSSCRQPLPPNKRKLHCSHCGRIFCAACLARTVAAGPRRAPAHVCGVCHTLLERHTRPYFSTEVPTSPD